MIRSPTFPCPLAASKHIVPNILISPGNPSGGTVHCRFGAPVQGVMKMRVPLSCPPPSTSTHLDAAWLMMDRGPVCVPVTVTDCDVLTAMPPLSVTVSVTVYVPAAA
jgi:hypothetical protein